MTTKRLAIGLGLSLAIAACGDDTMPSGSGGAGGSGGEASTSSSHSVSSSTSASSTTDAASSAASGESGGAGPGTGGAGTGGDPAGTGGAGGGAEPVCDGDGVPITDEQGAVSGDAGLFVYNSDPDTDLMDVLVVEHWFQYGAVEGPQTIEFSGESYADCSVCIVLLVDCERSFCQRFLVESGTLTVLDLDIDAGTYSATLNDAVAVEVNISGGSSEPVPNGATWCLDDLTIAASEFIQIPGTIFK